MAIFLFRKPTVTKKIIALGSTEHGTGVTTLSLALSNFLCSKQGRKVAYLELNATQQIASLSLGTGKDSFLYKGITIFPCTMVTSLPEILGMDFDVFILDMGVLNAYTAKEFAKCDRQFLLCSLSRWKLEHTRKKLQSLLTNIPFHKRITLIGSGYKTESNLQLFDGTSLHTLPAPIIQNPFQIHSELFPFFEEVLGKGK